MKSAKPHYMRFAGVLLFLTLSSFFTANSQSDDPPEILEIRQNYNFVNTQVSSGIYTHLTKEFPYCRGRLDQKREIWLDKNGAARLYSESGGTDDSAGSVDYYFDYKKRLDFVLIQYNNIYGDNAELRVYYNDSGKIIRSKQSGSPISEDFWKMINPNPIPSFNAPYQCKP